MQKFVLIVISLVIISCLGKRTPPAASAVFSEGKRLGQLTDKKLPEVSGLAASVTNPGYLWTHNDSGNPAVVYLVDEQLRIRLSCKLRGVSNRDWEDIAVGPGPDENKHYVYVADIGDNNERHSVKYIYRFEEPALKTGGGEITVTAFDTIAFRLEDGKKDTEAIMIDPATKNIYILSKRERPVHVYELKYPYARGSAVTAQRVASLPFTQIVAAGISKDGNEILMKNYDNIYYWTTSGRPIAEVLKDKPEVLAYEQEPQGEAIAFNPDGSGFYTLSEKISGEKIYLYFYERKKTGAE